MSEHERQIEFTGCEVSPGTAMIGLRYGGGAVGFTDCVWQSASVPPRWWQLVARYRRWRATRLMADIARVAHERHGSLT